MVELMRHPTGRGMLLRSEVIVPRPIEETFAFFADARNLEAITPPWLRFRIVGGPAGGATEFDSRIRYQLRLHGVPIGWDTRISAWEPPHRFVDEQVRGPYAWWRHEHCFEPAAPDATRMTDEVWYQPRGGRLLGAIAHAAFVGRDVRQIFAWRRERLLELLARPA